MKYLGFATQLGLPDRTVHRHFLSGPAWSWTMGHRGNKNHFTAAIELVNNFGCTGCQLAGGLRRGSRRESWAFESSSFSVSSPSSEDGEGVLTPNTPNVHSRISICYGHC